MDGKFGRWMKILEIEKKILKNGFSNTEKDPESVCPSSSPYLWNQFSEWYDHL